MEYALDKALKEISIDDDDDDKPKDHAVFTHISDLPSDIEEEVLSRVPMESTYLKSFTATVYSYASLKAETTTHLGGLLFGTLIWDKQGGSNQAILTTNMRCTVYALGYDKEKKHKVLRFVTRYDQSGNRICESEMYKLNSNASWKVIDGFAPDWRIPSSHRGLSLKGNTYWYAQEKFPFYEKISPNHPDFLLSFDFTTERFGPRLPLPFHARLIDIVTFSSVRVEQLVVLFQEHRAPLVKIWISNKIEPNQVSWNFLFLAVDVEPIIRFRFRFSFTKCPVSFFVDEEKKVAVILDRKTGRSSTSHTAHITGNNFYEKVVLGESTAYGCDPSMVPYVPSLVKICKAP
ncbi:PREDICTED: F-box/kelch-repeat protein At3g16740-like [Camelina sativa]|uniref:F-box/kelch-repeat protein At3g16740-like n=1 Tax=Camelina sativa TaxID=90675 RepID=A0ABM0Y4J5_CAMSA|nr:PREDICTED: F-box/kelch-repeat protein At3g16740-like [Camelina sativa]